jgi:Flp pilus assembly pilin Flp
MINIIRRAWRDSQAQDIAEYAVMLALILVIVVGWYDPIHECQQRLFVGCKLSSVRDKK